MINCHICKMLNKPDFNVMLTFSLEISYAETGPLILQLAVATAATITFQWLNMSVGLTYHK